MKYQIQINNGNANLGVTQKTISVNEVVEKVDIKFLAHHIHMHNQLVPEQVVEDVLENFAECSAELMAQGYAIPMMSGQDVYSRQYADIRIKGGNINLERARQLDPTIETEAQMVEKAGDLVSKAGLLVRARVEVEQKFTDKLLAQGASVTRVAGIKEVAFVEAASGGSSTDGGSGSSDGDSGSSDGSGDQQGGSSTPPVSDNPNEDG